MRRTFEVRRKSTIEMGIHGPATILLSGAPGTGKSTLQRLAPDFMRAPLGETAAFGTDDISMMVDPAWQRNDARLRRICKNNCINLARSMFENDMRVVLIAGNALYDKTDVNDYIAALAPMSDLYHFTLIANLESIVARMRHRGDDASHSRQFASSWLTLIRQHAGAWTCIIDTTDRSPEDVLLLIEQKIRAGERRLKNTIINP